MKYTPNLNLRKPDREDFYNVEDFNYNADILDKISGGSKIYVYATEPQFAGKTVTATATHPVTGDTDTVTAIVDEAGECVLNVKLAEVTYYLTCEAMGKVYKDEVKVPYFGIYTSDLSDKAIIRVNAKVITAPRMDESYIVPEGYYISESADGFQLEVKDGAQLLSIVTVTNGIAKIRVDAELHPSITITASNEIGMISPTPVSMTIVKDLQTTIDMAWKEKYAIVGVNIDTELLGNDVICSWGTLNIICTEHLKTSGIKFVLKSESTKYTFSCGEGIDIERYTPATLGNPTVLDDVEIPFVKLLPFSTCTEIELKKIIDAYYAGYIDLEDIKNVWQVGEERDIQLSTETRKFMIVSFDTTPLEIPINGKANALITLMNSKIIPHEVKLSTDTTMTTDVFWEINPIRTWCNGSYYNRFSDYWKELIKNSKRKCITQLKSTATADYIDKIFVPNFSEISKNTIVHASYYALTAPKEPYGGASNIEGATFDYFKDDSPITRHPEFIVTRDDVAGAAWMGTPIERTQGYSSHVQFNWYHGEIFRYEIDNYNNTNGHLIAFAI